MKIIIISHIYMYAFIVWYRLREPVQIDMGKQLANIFLWSFVPLVNIYFAYTSWCLINNTTGLRWLKKVKRRLNIDLIAKWIFALSVGGFWYYLYLLFWE